MKSPGRQAGSLDGWTAASSTGSHFDCLDGLRGVAILMVVTFHAVYFNQQHASAPVQIIGWLIQGGWMGVPLFFGLSGFLISYPFFLRLARTGGQSAYPRGYALKRLAKIVPPFYFSLVVFSSCLYFGTRDAGYFTTALHWAVGIPNLVRQPRQINGSYWSLIVEAQFYLVLPLLFQAVRRVKYEHKGWILFGTLLCLPFACRCLTWPPSGADEETVAFVFRRFPCQLDYFAWGVWFAWGYVGGVFSRWPQSRLVWLSHLGVGLLTASLMVWAYLEYAWHINSWGPPQIVADLMCVSLGLSVFLLLFFVYAPSSPIARFLCHPWLRFTGIISYEWFLFHTPVIVFFRTWMGASSGNLPKFLFIVITPVVATFIFSAALYRVLFPAHHEIPPRFTFRHSGFWNAAAPPIPRARYGVILDLPT